MPIIYQNNHSIHDAICLRDKEKVKLMVRDGVDINESLASFTPLWCSIAGRRTRELKRTELGNFEIVQLLLENGADPNKKCIFIPPIFRAAFEGDHDIVVELLLYGANPNSFAMIKCDMGPSLESGVAICKTPIVAAVEEVEPYVVEALIQYGAVYNKYLIKQALSGLEKLKSKKHKSYQDWIFYKEVKRVATLLEDNYDESMEEEVEKIKRENPTTGKIKNHFKYLGPTIVD